MSPEEQSQAEPPHRNTDSPVPVDEPPVNTTLHPFTGDATTLIADTGVQNLARIEASTNKAFWHKQPYKGVYIASWIFYAGSRTLPDAIIAFSGKKQREDWPVSWCVRVNFLRRVTHLMAQCGFYLGGRNLDKTPKSLHYSIMAWAPPIDDSLIRGTIAELADSIDCRPRRVPCFWFSPKYKRMPRRSHSNQNHKASPDDHVILHFHGGGYILGSAHESDHSVHISRGLLSRAKCQKVLSVDYRLATSESFPAALLDGLSAYSYLINECGYKPQNVICSGDSAGGHLALATSRYLRDHKCLPQFGGLILLSPLCDTTFSFRQIPDGSFRRNYESDIVDIRMSPYAVSLLSMDLPESVLRSPYLSPCARWDDSSMAGKHAPPSRFDPHPEEIETLFTDFPRTLIVAGEAERLLDECRELHSRMKMSGVDVTLHEEYGAIHDFIMMKWMEPCRTNALQFIGKWIRAGLDTQKASTLNSEVT